MKLVFADSCFFIALLSPDDKDHGRAEEYSRRLIGRLVTTEWIMTELADALSRPPHRERVGRFIERIRREPAVQMIPLDEDVFAAAWQLYRSRPDKDWSLTDCTSFIVMQREGITDALTGDRHFLQAGFQALMIQ